MFTSVPLCVFDFIKVTFSLPCLFPGHSSIGSSTATGRAYDCKGLDKLKRSFYIPLSLCVWEGVSTKKSELSVFCHNIRRHTAFLLCL